MKDLLSFDKWAKEYVKKAITQEIKLRHETAKTKHPYYKLLDRYTRGNSVIYNTIGKITMYIEDVDPSSGYKFKVKAIVSESENPVYLLGFGNSLEGCSYYSGSTTSTYNPPTSGMKIFNKSLSGISSLFIPINNAKDFYPKNSYLEDNDVKKVYTNPDIPQLDLAIQDIKYLCFYLNAKTAMKSMSADLSRISYIFRMSRPGSTLSIGMTKRNEVILKYNPEFIKKAIIQDYIMKYTIPGSYAKYDGAMSTVAFMVGHEMLHYRYGHLNNKVCAAMENILAGGNKKPHEDKLVKKALRSLVGHSIIEHQELQNNTLLEKLLGFATPNSGITTTYNNANDPIISVPASMMTVKKYDFVKSDKRSYDKSGNPVISTSNPFMPKTSNNVLYTVSFRHIEEAYSTSVQLHNLKDIKDFKAVKDFSVSSRSLPYYNMYLDWNKIRSAIAYDIIDDDNNVRPIKIPEDAIKINIGDLFPGSQVVGDHNPNLFPEDNPVVIITNEPSESIPEPAPEVPPEKATPEPATEPEPKEPEPPEIKPEPIKSEPVPEEPQPVPPLTPEPAPVPEVPIPKEEPDEVDIPEEPTEPEEEKPLPIEQPPFSGTEEPVEEPEATDGGEEDLDAVGDDVEQQDQEEVSDIKDESGETQPDPWDEEPLDISDLERVVDDMDATNEEIKVMASEGGRGGGSGGFGFLGSKASIAPTLTKEVQKWLNLFKIGLVDKTEYRPDVQSRKVSGLWGRELDVERIDKGKKIDKVVCFIFDLSGSMDTKLVSTVVSRIGWDLIKWKIINKYHILFFGYGAYLNLVPQKFTKFPGDLKKALSSSSDSYLDGAFRTLKEQMDKQKFKVVSIIIVSDFDLLGGNGSIPKDPGFNVPYLAIQLARNESAIGYLKSWISTNSKADIFGLSIVGSKLRIVKPLVAKKRLLR